MTDKIIQIAEEIFSGRENLAQIAPLKERFEVNTLEDAYAVQTLNTKRWITKGRCPVGYKIGLTSTAVQAQLGVDQPDFGTLWGEDAYASEDEIAVSRFMQPKAEAEIAFVLGQDINDPDLKITSLISAIAYALPAIEIVDSVIKDWKISLIDTVADNASGGGYVLGASPRKLDGLDLRLAGAVLSVNAEPRSMGLGAACMGHPLNAALWLCRKMLDLGHPMKEGDLILSGALGPMVNVHAGQTMTAEIQGFSTLNIYFGDG
ncbi:MAG: 2-keto-4-pentenoate hydratase [Rhodobacteraceae bacterium]|nr:MAG: 2-keto-4-pentenoate hydratase [Paracoccaceae bacterium]